MPSTGSHCSVLTQPPKELNGQYFAWQNLMEIVFPDKGLAPGETLEVIYGDRRGGSPGIRVQPFDESCFVFKTYVDARGDGEYLPLTRQPGDRNRGCRAVSFECGHAIRRRWSDQPTWCLVRAEDRYGNPAISYRGTIQFQLRSDTSAALPERTRFTAHDQGVHRFESLIFSHRRVVTRFRSATGTGRRAAIRCSSVANVPSDCFCGEICTGTR